MWLMSHLWQKHKLSEVTWQLCRGSLLRALMLAEYWVITIVVVLGSTLARVASTPLPRPLPGNKPGNGEGSHNRIMG